MVYTAATRPASNAYVVARDANAERHRPPLDVFPTHLAFAQLLDLHPQGVRVVVVKDDERFAHGQAVEGVEDQRVPLGPV